MNISSVLLKLCFIDSLELASVTFQQGLVAFGSRSLSVGDNLLFGRVHLGDMALHSPLSFETSCTSRAGKCVISNLLGDSKERFRKFFDRSSIEKFIKQGFHHLFCQNLNMLYFTFA